MLEVKYLVRGHLARQYQSSDMNSVWSLSSNLCTSRQRPLYIAGAQEMVFFFFFFEMTQKRSEAFFPRPEEETGSWLHRYSLHPW